VIFFNFVESALRLRSGQAGGKRDI